MSAALVPMRSLALLAALAGATLAHAAQVTFDLTVKHGQLPESMRTIKVDEGDEVKLRWSADRTITAHLHGYDIEKRIGPGATVEMTFTANATGRFPVEIHGAAGGEAPIAYVEVYPK
jgi:plastocyanin